MERFTPMEDFWCPELSSNYKVGFVYTIRPRYNVLERLVHEEWVPSGRVRMISKEEADALRVGRAKIGGSGTVSGPVPEKKKVKSSGKVSRTKPEKKQDSKSLIRRIFKWL